MNNTVRITLAILVLFALFFWVRSCNETHSRVISEAVNDQKMIVAVIDSVNSADENVYDYSYNFYINSIKYSGTTNTVSDKIPGDTVTVFYSAHDPAYNYYYNEKRSGYKFSMIDALVALILVMIIVLTVFSRRKKRLTKSG